MQSPRPVQGVGAATPTPVAFVLLTWTLDRGFCLWNQRCRAGAGAVSDLEAGAAYWLIVIGAAVGAAGVAAFGAVAGAVGIDRPSRFAISAVETGSVLILGIVRVVFLDPSTASVP